MFDLLFRNGYLLDGTGADGWPADLAVTGDRIAAIEPAEGALATAEATKIVDLGGLVLAPGFIDVHTHADYTLLADPRGKVRSARG